MAKESNAVCLHRIRHRTYLPTVGPMTVRSAYTCHERKGLGFKCKLRLLKRAVNSQLSSLPLTLIQYQALTMNCEPLDRMNHCSTL